MLIWRFVLSGENPGSSVTYKQISPKRSDFFAGLQHAVNLAKRNAEESCTLVASSWEFGCQKMATKQKESMNAWKLASKECVWYEWIDELSRMSSDEGKRLLLFGMVWFYFCLVNRKSFPTFLVSWYVGQERYFRGGQFWIGYFQIFNILNQISFSSLILIISNPAPLNRYRW